MMNFSSGMTGVHCSLTVLIMGEVRHNVEDSNMMQIHKMHFFSFQDQGWQE
jgi:hypothetical protein